MENYEHIFYADCPHFTVGRVDQWGEQGYLFFEGRVYAYEEDRKDQCGRTHSPMTIKEFLAFAEKNKITIPEDFLKTLAEAGRGPGADGIDYGNPGGAGGRR
ncbi:MAG: hypothetical protein JSS81_04115 [Acidobacteria bacterium]|nr:hypothetical protein [Acidobacteriota bacterium]